MKTLLRNLAHRWADKKLERANDDPRRQLMKSKERGERQAQELRRAARLLETASAELEDANAFIKEQRSELDRKDGQVERQADLFEHMREQIGESRRRVLELEQALVAASGKGWDEVYADVAGVAGPEAQTKHQCPEALLLDGLVHRCIRDGGHEGDHWNRGHQRQWPQVEVDENIEVPW